jgi:hypothetical protein
LKIVITSKQFARAHRRTSLLTYLIERALDRRDTTPPPEHEIGIAVFGGDRHAYFPADAPIVRVQTGRLRLAAYYGDEGAADPLRITVPVGRDRPPHRPGVCAGPCHILQRVNNQTINTIFFLA